MAAASSYVILAGFIVNAAVSGRHVYSAYAPNLNPQEAKTLSFFLNDLTFFPTSSITPANSNPSIFTFVGLNKPLKSLARKGSAFRIRQSPAVTVVEYILIKTSFSFGTGFSTSFNWRTSGGPYFVYTIAFI